MIQIRSKVKTEVRVNKKPVSRKAMGFFQMLDLKSKLREGDAVKITIQPKKP